MKNGTSNGSPAQLEHHQGKHSCDLDYTSDTCDVSKMYTMTEKQRNALFERISRKQSKKLRQQTDLDVKLPPHIKKALESPMSRSQSNILRRSPRNNTRKRKYGDEDLTSTAVDTSPIEKSTRPKKSLELVLPTLPNDEAKDIANDEEEPISGTVNLPRGQKSATPKKSPKLILHKSPKDDAKAKANDEAPTKKKRISLITIRDRNRTEEEKDRHLSIKYYQVMKASKRHLKRAGATVTHVDGVDDESSNDSEQNDFSD